MGARTYLTVEDDLKILTNDKSDFKISNVIQTV